MQDIHDLKPLMSIAFPWLSFLIVLCILLGLLLLSGWLLWRFIRKHRAITEPQEDPPEVLLPEKKPREQALDDLNGLLARSLPVPLYYQTLESILKTFLEALHREPITGFTTAQVLAYLKTHGYPSLDEFQVKALFQHSQQAKFAGYEISEAFQKQDFEAAVDFVQRYTVGT